MEAFVIGRGKKRTGELPKEFLDMVAQNTKSMEEMLIQMNKNDSPGESAINTSPDEIHVNAIEKPFPILRGKEK